MLPDSRGYYGPYGGRYVPETLIPALNELTGVFQREINRREFLQELDYYLKEYAGRPTPLYYARNLSRRYPGLKVYLKREDLTHTGAHKINNTLGQGLLARRGGKKRLIAETGAGQHGVAAATVAALLEMEAVVYMGAEDMRRQAPNVQRMNLLGAEVRQVRAGSATLKEATSEAIRDWVASSDYSHYLLGSVSGPHPYPLMVRTFQKVIGEETRRQLQQQEGRLPGAMVACVGGGSNAAGLFYPFLEDEEVELYGVEAAGLGLSGVEHAATLNKGRAGVLHGTRSYLLQDEWGQVSPVHSVSAGLDYPGVGPEHAYLKDIGRVTYEAVSDEEALRAFRLLCRCEGIIPALESSHALAYLEKLSSSFLTSSSRVSSEIPVVVCLSGRGDKDLGTVSSYEEERGGENE